MTFEEVKKMFKKSIDTTDTMNQAIENLIQSIYLTGYNDALKEEIKVMREDKGVLKQLAEKQNSLLVTVKAWNRAIEKNGYVN